MAVAAAAVDWAAVVMEAGAMAAAVWAEAVVAVVAAAADWAAVVAAG